MTPVAGNLIRLRMARNLSQARLARLALLTPANLCAIETGRSDPSVGTLCRIATALEIDPRALLAPPARRRSRMGRFTRDAVARAAITGRRQTSPALETLARGLAAAHRRLLDAANARGARRASRRAWRDAQLTWDPVLLDELAARVQKLAWSADVRPSGDPA